MGEAELKRLLEAGLRLFNGGQYFEAHEAWEDLWKSTEGPYSLLFKGLAQLSVSLEHARRGNLRGAASVGRRSLDLLSRQQTQLRLAWLSPLLIQVGFYLEHLGSQSGSEPLRLPEELLSLPLERDG